MRYPPAEDCWTTEAGFGRQVFQSRLMMTRGRFARSDFFSFYTTSRDQPASFRALLTAANQQREGKKKKKSSKKR
jgi:hypothetical protein